MTSQSVLADITGATPRFFRPGTAYFDEVSADIVRAVGLIPVNFSINGDGGATLPAASVYQQFTAATAGDIVIAHANRPGSGTAAGVAEALPVLSSKGAVFLRLSDAPPR